MGDKKGLIWETLVKSEIPQHKDVLPFLLAVNH
jgi:hypothetical protein